MWLLSSVGLSFQVYAEEPRDLAVTLLGRGTPSPGVPRQEVGS